VEIGAAPMLSSVCFAACETRQELMRTEKHSGIDRVSTNFVQAYWGVVLSQWAGSHLKAALKDLLSSSQQFYSQIWGAEEQLGQQSYWIGKTNMCMVKTLTWR